MSKRKKTTTNYPNGGDEMFFYHKKTKHPAKQISHSEKTWTNKRYTHRPNRLKDYVEDTEYSDFNNPVFCTKAIFIDSIYTRGKPYKMKKSVDKQRTLIAEQFSSKTRRLTRRTSLSNIIKTAFINKNNKKN